MVGDRSYDEEACGESVVSGRGTLLVAVVLASAVIGAGLLVAALLDSSWPVWLCVAVVVAYGTRPALYQWQHRRELGALRRARRRIISTYNAWELRSMAGATPAALVDLVSAQCDATDREGRHLFIEVHRGQRGGPDGTRLEKGGL